MSDLTEDSVNHLWTLSVPQIHPWALIVVDEDATAGTYTLAVPVLPEWHSSPDVMHGATQSSTSRRPSTSSPSSACRRRSKRRTRNCARRVWRKATARWAAWNECLHAWLSLSRTYSPMQKSTCILQKLKSRNINSRAKQISSQLLQSLLKEWHWFDHIQELRCI